MGKVRTDALVPNPHNPRLLFDREPLETLRASIEKSGILVPLTVYWDPARDRNVILDGQRRWICATELGMAEVPVNLVAEPTLVQNIVTMFQIHKLREDWELMPTALKLEVLMDEIGDRNERRLAAITGLDRAVVSRCKKLLDYPRRFQDMMLDADPKLRVKADFFIELHAVRNDRFVNGLDWYSRNDFTDAMLLKYTDGDPGLKSVTDFRIIKQNLNVARKAGLEELAGERLREFQADIDLPASHLRIESAETDAVARRVAKAAAALAEEVGDLDPQTFVGENEMWALLTKLADAIDAKLKAIGHRPRS